MQYAILIDGGFAKRKIGSAKAPATAQNFECLIDRICKLPQLQNHHLHRVYYYDSTPLESSEKKPLAGGLIEFSKQDIVARSRTLFEQLYKLPYVALRLGELTFNGWVINQKTLSQSKEKTIAITHADLLPKISQKGVDMRIGMDIAALTLKKQVQIIVLVTGDSDFIPAMKFARREATQLFLTPLGHNIRPAMYEHSDLVLDVELP